ncbi:GTP-binding protein [Achlya hypogyna]|uniref:Elongation factor Tu, chloroplastic n=1 Tax=Achlya hypogyna TaxID=1202772 RepID=A0A1V9YAW1_ACHHY|nr:GTP-binding protein [Achlya hypogyna]
MATNNQAHEQDNNGVRTLRIAFVGNVDSGKSSLIGTLIRGELDDGRGLSRQAIFRHKHELESGRTSSIATAYMGFDAQGDQVVAKRSGRVLPWSELAKYSHKKIQLIDLAGHERYLKTTVYGLTGMQPDLVVVVVGANMGVKKMTLEHLGITMSLEIPVVIALTKIDIAPKNVARETLQTIRKSLRQYGKMGMLVKTIDEATSAAKGVPSNRLTPILPMSNVTGDGLANLRHLIWTVDVEALARSALSFAAPVPDATPATLSVEMPIDDSYQVPGAGFVIAGTMVSGVVKPNDVLKLGPDHNGHFTRVVVRSIESMYVPLKEVRMGQTTAMAVRCVNKKVVLNRATFRKGMVLVSANCDVSPYVSRRFEAQTIILHHQTTITTGYQPMINCRTIRQTAAITGIVLDDRAPSSNQDDQVTIRTGDRATVQFCFVSHPEFLKVGMRFVFRDGQAKGIGQITRVLPDEKVHSTDL